MRYLKSAGVDPSTYLQIQANYLRFLAIQCNTVKTEIAETIEKPEKPEKPEKIEKIEKKIEKKPEKVEKHQRFSKEVINKSETQKKARGALPRTGKSMSNSLMVHLPEKQKIIKKNREALKHSTSFDDIPVKTSVSFQYILERELKKNQSTPSLSPANKVKHQYLKRNKQTNIKINDTNKLNNTKSYEELNKSAKKENQLENRGIIVNTLSNQQASKPRQKQNEKKNEENKGNLNESQSLSKIPKEKKPFLKKGKGMLCLNKRTQSEAPDKDKIIEKKYKKFKKSTLSISHNEDNSKAIIIPEPKSLNSSQIAFDYGKILKETVIKIKNFDKNAEEFYKNRDKELKDMEK